MKYIQIENLRDLTDGDGLGINVDTAVTIGKFDGFHSGHQLLLKRIIELEEKGVRSVVLKLNNRSKEQLLDITVRQELLAQMGIGYFVECPLVPEITGMSPEGFISNILVKSLRAKYIVVGSDFRFGHNREGDSDFLKAMQSKYDYKVEIFNKKQYHGRDVSSTYIREELARGNTEIVEELLGHQGVKREIDTYIIK